MIEGISAVTLATHEMPRAVRFYRALGFEVLHGDEESSFTSFRVGVSYLNLIAQPAERRWSWWGRVIFYVADVDALYDRALAAGYQPTTVPRDVNRHAFGTPPHINARVLMCRRNLWTDGVPIGADRDPICLTEYSFGSNGWVRFNPGSHLGAETQPASRTVRTS